MSPELPYWGKASILIALMGLLAAIGFGVAPHIVSDFGWRTRSGGPLDLDPALRSLYTEPNTPIAIRLAEGEGAVVVMVGTQLTGSDTSTADCSARTASGAKVAVEMRPSVDTTTTSNTVRSDEQVVLDGAIRPGGARDILVQCSMGDSGIRGISVLVTNELVFPEPIGWLDLARNLALGVLVVAVAVTVGAVFSVQRRQR